MQTSVQVLVFVVVHSIHLAYETRFEKVGAGGGGVTGARNEKVTQ